MSTHWRILEDGSEGGRRVITKQVEVGGELQTVILDGVWFRPLKDNERLRQAEPVLVQVDTSWVA
jgi:hypothetical protein